ncbi:MAG TPA: hypothetical protein VKE74_12625 [Gemmataceae bacterium]|nr:hypothetical protein [Gemmataceae bacterium]
MRHVVRLAAVAVTAAVVGCGGTPKSDASPAELNQLTEVVDLVKLYVEQRGKAPAGVADLRVFENAYPVGYEAVRSGEVVVSWGGRPADRSSAVLAYHKAVPTTGGWVALASGEVKQMTADEFKSAPRAGK